MHDDLFMLSPIAGIIVAAVVAAAWFIYQFRANQKRFEDLWAFSMELGLEFSVRDPFNIPEMYSRCDLFSQGYDKEASHVVHGRLENLDVKAFDYKYETGSGKSHQVHRLSCVVLDTDLLFRFLTIRPEGFADRIAGVIGFDDIDFESDEFSRAFYVKSEDKKFAYDVIHPRMMRFLLTSPKWNVQLVGRSVIIHTGSPFTFRQFRSAIAFGQEFLGLFPEYLKKELEGSREVT